MDSDQKSFLGSLLKQLPLAVALQSVKAQVKSQAREISYRELIHKYPEGTPSKTRAVTAIDQDTGQLVPKVFYYDPNTHCLARIHHTADGKTYYNDDQQFVLTVWEKRKLVFE